MKKVIGFILKLAAFFAAVAALVVVVKKLVGLFKANAADDELDGTCDGNCENCTVCEDEEDDDEDDDF